MEAPMFQVVVPATTANLGPGYDCIGLAIGLSMTIDVARAETWSVRYDNEEYRELPHDETNLIVQTIQKVAEEKQVEATPLALIVSTDIPLGKGLGSSASAIVAGIAIANEAYQLDIPVSEQLRLATTYEGHADNANAALLGGLVFSYYDGETLDVAQLPAPEMDILLLVPEGSLATEESRSVLPKSLPHDKATSGSAAGTVLAAAFASNDLTLAGRMIERDTFHEPYRKKMFIHFDAIRHRANELGAYAMTISGAGPSLIVFTPLDKTKDIALRLAREYDEYTVIETTPSAHGVLIKD